MAGLQSYRRLLMFNTFRFISRNRVLFLPNQRKYHLFCHAYSSPNRLVFQKSALMSCTGKMLTYRLESTSITQPKNTNSVTSNLQTPETKNESVQLNNEADITRSSDVVIDESTLPPVPTPYLTEVPDVEFISTGLSEPSFQSLGLGSWWPSGIVQQILEYFHINLGLPWWEAIIVGTIICRILLFPVYVKSRREQIHLMNHFPEITKFQQKISKAKLAGDYYSAANTSQEFMEYMKEKKLNFFTMFKVTLYQAPVFISMFYGLKKMAALPVETLKTEGLFWFQDLTQPDPYYILPLILSVTLLAIIELGAEGGPLKRNSQITKVLMRGIPVVLFFFSTFFPSCITLYWTTSNIIVLSQVTLFKVPHIRKILKIPQARPLDPTNLPVSKKGFIEELKEGFNNAKLTGQLKERERINLMAFQKAGTGPVPRTFKNNPVFQKEK